MPFAHVGEIAALGTAGCWAITSMAFESAGRRIGSLAVNLVRLALALVPLTLLCALERGRALPTDATLRAWIWLSASGIVGFTVGDLCLFRAFVVVGARVSVLLMTMVPPFTALIGLVLLGERLSALDWAGMALTVGGVTWVVRERSPDPEGRLRDLPRSGILLGVGGALGQALGLVMSKEGMGDYHPIAATQIRVLAGLIGFAVLFVFIGWWPRVIVALRDKKAMARTSLGAFFGPFLGVSLSLIAVKHTEAGVAATLMALVPVMIIPLTIVVRKERVTSRSVLGAAVAVAGAGLLFW